MFVAQNRVEMVVKSPRILIINYVYPALLQRFSVVDAGEYSQFLAFSENVKAWDFGIDHATADVLQTKGWAPTVLIANSVIGWTAWLREQRHIGFWQSIIPKTLLQAHRLLGRKSLDQRAWGCFAVLAAELLRTDVLYFGHPAVLSGQQARRLKRKDVFLVLNHSASVPDEQILSHCDGFVSCVRWLTDHAERRGINALHLRLGFKDHGVSSVTDSAEKKNRDIEVSFVGTVSANQHANTVPLLEAIAQEIDGLEIYGPASKLVTDNEILGPLYIGEAWGKEMAEVLERSKVTVNRHGDAPGGEAANMRLYEATGAGAALVTDRRKFIEEIFTPGLEVVLYDSPAEAVARIRDLLSADKNREKIALAGQKKTLSLHTIRRRGEVLDEFLRDLLGESIVR